MSPPQSLPLEHPFIDDSHYVESHEVPLKGGSKSNFVILKKIEGTTKTVSPESLVTHLLKQPYVKSWTDSKTFTVWYYADHCQLTNDFLYTGFECLDIYCPLEDSSEVKWHDGEKDEPRTKDNIHDLNWTRGHAWIVEEQTGIGIANGRIRFMLMRICKKLP